MNFQFSLSLEVVRGLQILAALVVMVCVSALISAGLILAGADLTPRPGESGAFRMIGFTGLIEAFSLFFFFALLEFPWDITKWNEPDKPKSRPKTPPRKPTTRKKKSSG